MAKVLIIDDDESLCDLLSRTVRKMGHTAACRHTLFDGIEETEASAPDVVFLDVSLPDGNGLEALPRFANTPLAPEVIIITGQGDPNGAELAIRSGAWDYVEKPASLQGLTLQILRALQYREEKRSKGHGSTVALKLEGLIGDSPPMQAAFDLLAQVATTDANVLVTGETGTGKELMAAAVHRNSPRAAQPFVILDCSSLPETIVESTLFGHERGAFTGADKAKKGLILQAHGGTLFLDEVGELPLAIQKAFLRVLQERRFRPLGGCEEVESDFRLVAATNRDLEEMVRAGLFREDLYFRLKTFIIPLPRLRDRIEDIRALTLHHVARICQRYGTGMKGFSPELVDAIALYPWPGNVRELFHALERAIAAARFEVTLFPKHLPEEIRIHYAKASLNRSSAHSIALVRTPSARATLLPFRDFRSSLEQQYLRDLLAITEGDLKEACRLSGLSRSRLYELLKQHELR